MDEATLTQQQYYIATKSAPTDDRARVLKYGSMFAVFDRLGDISHEGLGEQGIFYEGTRYLSEMTLRLWNEHPLLLSSTIEPNNFLFTADLANLDVSRGDSVAIHRGTLHLLRSRFLWRGTAYEELEFVNYGMASLCVPLAIFFAADFTDIFEVRGMARERRGQRLPDDTGRNSIVLAYEGLDNVIRRMRITCDPVPELITGPELRFEFELKPKEARRFHLRMECENGAESQHNLSYPQARNRAFSEMNASAEMFPRIHSSNSRFNDWMNRSFADVQMMTVGNREHDYPYAGVPWFSTVFGRDGIITAMETLWIAPAIAKGVLEFLAETQATEVNESREAEPGKILHELRHGEMANLGEIPFARYYGSVDATPLFVMLAGDYYQRTGDKSLIKQLWPNILAALRWMDDYGDIDGDGFVEYAPHGNKGLVQQGWKDSNDSVFHADGSLATPEEVQHRVPKVDVLVNNAGFGVFGKFAEKSLVEELNMMQLNMTALVSLTGLYLPAMISAKSGKIMNVASTAAFQPGPLMAIYYATKAFVLSFSEAIANELEGSGVTVSTLCPGPTTSDFQERAQMQNSGLVKRRKMMDAKTVAEIGYRGLMAGKTIVIPGLGNKLMAQSIRFSPRSMVTKVVRRMQEEQ